MKFNTTLWEYEQTGSYIAGGNVKWHTTYRRKFDNI